MGYIEHFLGQVFFLKQKIRVQFKIVLCQIYIFYTNNFLLVKKIFLGQIVFFSIIFLANNFFFHRNKKKYSKSKSSFGQGILFHSENIFFF